MKFSCSIFCFLLTLGFVACSSTSQATKKGTRPPPTEMGVRITSNGEAVAEVDGSADKLFEVVENDLRARYKVTFINHNLRQIEAENKKHLFAIKITALTTGKTGLSVAVIDREDNHSETALARDMADEILSKLHQNSRL